MHWKIELYFFAEIQFEPEFHSKWLIHRSGSNAHLRVLERFFFASSRVSHFLSWLLYQKKICKNSFYRLASSISPILLAMGKYAVVQYLIWNMTFSVTNIIMSNWIGAHTHKLEFTANFYVMCSILYTKKLIKSTGNKAKCKYSLYGVVHKWRHPILDNFWPPLPHRHTFYY